MGDEPVVAGRQHTRQVELTPGDVRDAHWFYDTPGITKENCVCIRFLLEIFTFRCRCTVLTGRQQEVGFHLKTRLQFLYKSSSRMTLSAVRFCIHLVDIL